ncbi:MAG TPA: DUF3097 family protein [Acidimicrobiales bacterium]|nr:DUF3097 family protein [Acidimicrobiales bacterium]
MENGGNGAYGHRGIYGGSGILAGPLDDFGGRGAAPKKVKAEPGLQVLHRATRFMGRVVRVDGGGVVLRSPSGTQRHFPLRTGDFLVGGEVATLVAAPPAAPVAPVRKTASGSRAVIGAKARVARASRILVEGIHDAELVEKVWGDDLRVDGVVVERLDGIDHLQALIDEFAPGPDARLGVLVDHLVPRSKESRLAEQVSGPFVRVLGTPFVDVWQAVRPCVLGIDAWPVVPPGRPWKEGICEAFGEPEPALMWNKLLARVKTYADLEPALVGAVEALIDFVTIG